MKFSFLVVLLLWMQTCSCLAVPQDADRVQAAAAREILDAWHHTDPEPRTRVLHVVCWTPANRSFPENYQQRLTRIMKHIQGFYLREMERFGFTGHTIGLQFDADEQLVLHAVEGVHEMSHYAVQSGDEIRRECLPTLKKAGIDPENETVMIICNLATWDSQRLRFSHQSPYYAGGSFRRGVAWQLDSPELDSRNLKLASPMIRDGQYGRISLGKHNSIFIGGIAHELGHALGLPHCRARPDEAVRGTALMGSGNRTYGDELRGDGRGSFLTLAHALRLAAHPQFSGSVKGLRARADAAMNDLSITTNGKSIDVSGVVDGSPAVYAVVAYFDPDGGGDYDATTATAVPDAEGRFKLTSDALVAGKGGELRLFPLHVNGSAAGQMSRTKYRYRYEVAADGTPDLSTIQTRSAVQPLLAALAGDDRPRAIKIYAAMKPGVAASIARNLLHPRIPTRTPVMYDGAADVVNLTRLLPEAEKVGWGQPTYNRVPDQSRLLESAGRIFETGIYAHAPARHTYRLGGKWNSLNGSAGLASGHPGSVQFEVLGDGKSLWKSSVVKPGTLVDYDIPVDGVGQLELRTLTTSDGAEADWALWLQPALHRRPRG